MGKTVVIGGGAAGIAAAVAAAAAGSSVELYEKNEKLGKKLFITGKGRCNLTNACDMKTMMENVVSNPKFLYSSFRQFTNEDIMRLVSDAGCPLKTERGGRVFPESDHSADVIRSLERLLKQGGVTVRLNSKAERILTAEDRCTGVRLQNGETVSADAVIVATGGLAYPSTGSDGDGFRFARETGHRVTELTPSLVPLTVKEASCEDLMGLSLKNVRISLTDGKKEIYTEFGEMLFTHFGVSGPVILSASSFAGPVLKNRQLQLSIDLKPALSEEKLDARILRDFSEEKNRELKNALSALFPARLIPEVIRQSGISPERKVHDLTREERAKLVRATKNLSFTVTGTRGYNEAVITKGGISVRDIDPSTMESRHVRGLYFAGEVLDVDALTGGFNLQIAWSTGYAAGTAAGKAAEEVRDGQK